MGAAGRLPSDVWAGVLDDLALINARSTIAALSLTYSGLRLPSQRALYRSLTFTGRTDFARLERRLEVIQKLRSISNSRLRICPYLEDVSLGYCTWLNDEPEEDTSHNSHHSVAVVDMQYRVPSGGCMGGGGSVQIPALLYATRTLVRPSQIQRLSILAYHGLEDIIAQLATSASPFIQLTSLTIMCPQAASASNIVSLLRICPMLEELSFDRRDYPNRRVQWNGPDQQDERESINRISSALTTETFGSDRFLPALNTFTGSPEEAIAIINHALKGVTRLEVHRTFEHIAISQFMDGYRFDRLMPNEAIDEIIDILETISAESRRSITDLRCVDQQWDTLSEDPKVKVEEPPQRVRIAFPNLRSFFYHGPDARKSLHPSTPPAMQPLPDTSDEDL
ncbi:hypothetical protein BKA62DRAFT_721046 [Auriculariales sp. MPI-PUGE-AT-0066]|nr:hypothetical protein BKA62DRAFT_721046 [Auriculariales sp. MPI-PUGE-AT-0066]